MKKAQYKEYSWPQWLKETATEFWQAGPGRLFSPLVAMYNMGAQLYKDVEHLWHEIRNEDKDIKADVATALSNIEEGMKALERALKKIQTKAK